MKKGRKFRIKPDLIILLVIISALISALMIATGTKNAKQNDDITIIAPESIETEMTASIPEPTNTSEATVIPESMSETPIEENEILDKPEEETEDKPVLPSEKTAEGLTEGNTYEMRIYHYCPCNKCTPGERITASGKTPKIGMVAMKGLPFGTIIEINGNQYAVEDRGVGSMKVDIFTNSHTEALDNGTYMAGVTIFKIP